MINWWKRPRGQHAETIALVKRLSSIGAKGLPFSETADQVALEFRNGLRADAVSIHFLQSDGYLEMVASKGCTQEHIAHWRRIPRNMIPILNSPDIDNAFYVGTASQFKSELPEASRLIERSRRHTIAYAPLCSNGRTCGIIGFSFNSKPPTIDRDLTLAVVHACAQTLESARLLEEERQTRIAAEAANCAKTRFLANMSHEIRSPLGVIEGFGALLADSEELSSEHRQWARNIRRNSRQLVEIIGDVLDISKIEAEKVECEKIPIRLTELLADVEAAVKPAADDKGLELNFLLDGVPESFTSDPTRIKQVLINLLTNAIKFTLAGEVTVAVKHTPSSELQFEITDTGIGIPLEMQTRIFDPFTQADSTMSRRFGGSGLGLAIAKRLASILGGELKLVFSAPGSGTQFLFSLPCEPGSCSEGATVEQKGTELAGKRILLVEDSIDSQELIRHFLQREGALVDIASNGVAGIRMAMEGEYNAVLMDIQMPGLDGYQTVRVLRSRGFAKPIAALTAHALQTDKDRAAAKGFDDYLTKPIDQPTLVASLQKLLH